MVGNPVATDSYITYVSSALEQLKVNHALSWVKMPRPGWQVELLGGDYVRRLFHWHNELGWSYRAPQAVEEMWVRRGPGELELTGDEIAAQIVAVATNARTGWSYQILMPNSAGRR